MTVVLAAEADGMNDASGKLRESGGLLPNLSDDAASSRCGSSSPPIVMMLLM